MGGNNSTSGVFAACMKLREAVVAAARRAAWRGGIRRRHRARRRTRRAAGGTGGPPGGWPARTRSSMANSTRSTSSRPSAGISCEVAVDAHTGETRVRRMLAVCAAGRIINPLTARSQVIGAMTMGEGAALMEELAVDKRRGFFVNHDLAGYEVPVHADIPHQEVVLPRRGRSHFFADESQGRRRAGLCAAWARRSRTPSTTPPAFASATIRSRWTS